MVAGNSDLYWDVEAVYEAVQIGLSATWDTRETVYVSKFTYASWDTDDVLTNTSTEALYPTDLAKVPCLTPRFQLTVDSDLIPGTFLCQVRVSTDPTFTTEESWSPVQFTPTNSVGDVCRVPAGSSLSDNAVYYWGTRAGRSGTWSEWSANESFETDTAYGGGVHYGALADVVTYSGVEANPIVWFLDQEFITPGEQVTVYGKNLSGAVEVGINDTIVSPDSVVTVAGTGDEFTSDREITKSTQTITIEHDEVTFTVPVDIDEDVVSAIYVGVE